MRIAELWRYPVKSLQGERLGEAVVGAHGIEGDRRFAIFDAHSGERLTARRHPRMLFASGRFAADGRPEIVLPDGTPARDDAALSEWLGHAVVLREAPPGEAPFHDSRHVRISLVSTATIGDWDRRRFRPNVLLDGAGEDDLVGATIRLGAAALAVGRRIERCVMTTRAQPGGIPADPSVLRAIARERDTLLAIGATVARPGIVRVGDALDTRPLSAGAS